MIATVNPNPKDLDTTYANSDLNGWTSTFPGNTFYDDYIIITGTSLALEHELALRSLSNCRYFDEINIPSHKKKNPFEKQIFESIQARHRFELKKNKQYVFKLKKRGIYFNLRLIL